MIPGCRPVPCSDTPPCRHAACNRAPDARRGIARSTTGPASRSSTRRAGRAGVESTTRISVFSAGSAPGSCGPKALPVTRIRATVRSTSSGDRDSDSQVGIAGLWYAAADTTFLPDSSRSKTSASAPCTSAGVVGVCTTQSAFSARISAFDVVAVTPHGGSPTSSPTSLPCLCGLNTFTPTTSKSGDRSAVRNARPPMSPGPQMMSRYGSVTTDSLLSWWLGGHET